MSFKKWIESRKDKGVVTFDFDNTLTLPFWDEENEIWSSSSEKPCEENVRKLKKYASQGYSVYVVTARKNRDRPEVVQFAKDNELPIIDVIATGGPKGKMLSGLNSLIHHDDSPQVFEDPESLFKGKWVKVFHPFDKFE